ncbi:hypothetical protein [Vibrio parahaemolyticus]|uniref:hypothetical protein n=1 Tax=Vibrio parahaemolyticus TaxID=670 RepID=UPI001EE9B4F2|nr:hypothetical protein [Vibrio parahaemolyticus]MCG6428447.1 hypothetical protein [Vibrio parahaemolyticus]
MGNQKTYEYGLVVKGITAHDLHVLPKDESGQTLPLETSRLVSEKFGLYGELYVETPPWNLNQVHVMFGDLESPISDLPPQPRFCLAVMKELLNIFPGTEVEYTKYETER